MAIWPATVALRSESGHNFFFKFDPAEHFRIQMAPCNWYADEIAWYPYQIHDAGS